MLTKSGIVGCWRAAKHFLIPHHHPASLPVQLFFAKVLRSATEDEVRVLFSGFGKVYDVNLFRAFQGAPTTKVWVVLFYLFCCC